MPRTTTTTALALGALVLSAVTLTGCSGFGDLAHDRVTSEASTRADLSAAPAWMPADAEEITSVSGTGGTASDTTPTTIVFTSADGVTADDCTTAPRQSAPTMDVEGAPNVYKAAAVLRCGPWSMTSKGDRWIAWTPNPGDGGS
ncbi:hypothetical protein DEJ23_04585 [Curtobacterium sp. MCSS17_008]|uniref:hypothetical protein n=1 Tax=Curtobacterium sp. MCSS17_008 TaxID=2175647 RepID=UPI000DA81D43|nr:hypothetical protein [Curtobacterium sp. MCSS17_008]PZF58180.1 hypothetical protein DEJ23_04585 [Curtobacterium sp. MCSS17_008]